VLDGCFVYNIIVANKVYIHKTMNYKYEIQIIQDIHFVKVKGKEHDTKDRRGVEV
jgi:hypothetical protein